MAYLEPLVLQNLLDGDVLLLFGNTKHLCLKDDAKRAVPDDLAVGVLDVFLFAGLAVRGDDFDDLGGVVEGCGGEGGEGGGEEEIRKGERGEERRRRRGGEEKIKKDSEKVQKM